MSVSLPITTRPRAGFLSYHTDSSTRGKENTRPKNQRHFNSGLLHAETKLKQIRNPTRKTHPPITAHLLNSTSTFSQDIRPGNASTTNQNPSSARLQLAKQGFCFSLGSNQPPRFAQEENSQKPEPQLKQPRSSTKETGHTDQTLHDPCHISSKLGFHFKGHAFRTLKPRPQA